MIVDIASHGVKQYPQKICYDIFFVSVFLVLESCFLAVISFLSHSVFPLLLFKLVMISFLFILMKCITCTEKLLMNIELMY